MIGKRFRPLPFIFANDNYTLRGRGRETSCFIPASDPGSCWHSPRQISCQINAFPSPKTLRHLKGNGYSWSLKLPKSGGRLPFLISCMMTSRHTLKSFTGLPQMTASSILRNRLWEKIKKGGAEKTGEAHKIRLSGQNNLYSNSVTRSPSRRQAYGHRWISGFGICF